MDRNYGYRSNSGRYSTSKRQDGSGFWWLLMIFSFVGIAVLSYLVFFKEKSDVESNQEILDDSQTTDSELDGQSVETETDEVINDTGDDFNDEPSNLPSTDGVVSLSDLNNENQQIGSEISDVEFSLQSIEEDQYDKYYLFSFILDTDSDLNDSEIPTITARYIPGAGYLRVVLDQVTSDQAGIGYQSSRRIDEQGISQLYHDVSANQSEEVYNIGVTQNPDIYLTNDGLTIMLYVAYPGVADVGEYEDMDDFTQEDSELESVNEDSNVKLTGYSWGVEGNVLKFTWDVSSTSDNPIPPVSAEYSKSSKLLELSFEGLTSDIILDNDTSFSSNLTKVAERVRGSRSGGVSKYSFDFDQEIEYKMYRNLSPNQVVLEIQAVD